MFRRIRVNRDRIEEKEEEEKEKEKEEAERVPVLSSRGWDQHPFGMDRVPKDWSEFAVMR